MRRRGKGEEEVVEEEKEEVVEEEKEEEEGEGGSGGGREGRGGGGGRRKWWRKRRRRRRGKEGEISLLYFYSLDQLNPILSQVSTAISKVIKDVKKSQNQHIGDLCSPGLREWEIQV